MSNHQQIIYLIKRKKECQKFKFGPSETFISDTSYKIKVQIGALTEFIWVSVVDADIPFLLGVDYQDKLGMVLDINKRQIYF